jgi:hypothetical protein
MSYMFDPLSMLWTYQCFERNASRRRAAVKDRSAYGLELSEMWGSISWGRFRTAGRQTLRSHGRDPL